MTRKAARLLAAPLFAALIATASPARAAADPEEVAAAVDTSNPKVQAEARAVAARPAMPPPRARVIRDDHSGRRQVGKASIYSGKFQGRKMANGRRFDHRGSAAASKTLPLGTVAKVTNTANGQTAVVTVQDRGPFIDGRTVDLSKATAQQLGISARDGVAPVVVSPIAVPQPDGSVKVGAGAAPGPALP